MRRSCSRARDSRDTRDSDEMDGRDARRSDDIFLRQKAASGCSIMIDMMEMKKMRLYIRKKTDRCQ